uniref:Uncharacterized protein n=1 Tax=Panagrolaimus sp. JU765 TaxID=591449 RepID=A0AC34RSP1_9BILA
MIFTTDMFNSVTNAKTNAFEPLKTAKSLEIQGNEFIIEEHLSPFAVAAKLKDTSEKYYIRVESRVIGMSCTILHVKTLQQLLNNNKLFIKHGYAKYKKNYHLICRYHTSLAQVMAMNNGIFSQQSALFIGTITFRCIIDLHCNFHIHRNIKPSSFFTKPFRAGASLKMGSMTKTLNLTRQSDQT